MNGTRTRLALFLTLLAAAAVAQEIRDFPDVVGNWPAAPYWDGAEASGARLPASPAEALAWAPSSPVPFIGVKPCRIADTRNPAFSSGYGPPAMAANVSRDFVLAGQCGSRRRPRRCP